MKDTSLTADNLRDGGRTKEEISISPLSTSTKRLSKDRIRDDLLDSGGIHC